jgi:hypothetical protein
MAIIDLGHGVVNVEPDIWTVLKNSRLNAGSIKKQKIETGIIAKFWIFSPFLPFLLLACSLKEFLELPRLFRTTCII